MPRLRFIARTPRFGRGKTGTRSLDHSPYYWLWRYLKASSSYGPTSPAYADFGDLGENSPEGFRKWWRSHELLFAEPELAIRMKDVTDLAILKTLDLNDYMVVVVGLDVPKRTTKRTFARLLDKRKKGLKGGKVFERSKAKFKFATVPVTNALKKTLKVYEAKQQGGTLWQIGERAGIAQSFRVQKSDTKKVAAGNKLKMSVTVRRYLNHANGYLANVPLGLFPRK